MRQIIGAFIVMASLSWAQTPIENVASGCALDFPGNAYVDCGDIPDPPFAGTQKQMTIEAWIKPENYVSPYAPIVVKYNTSLGGAATFFFALTSAGNLRFTVYTPTNSGLPPGGINAVTTTVVPLNQWIHVTGTVNLENQQMRLYINGIEQPTSLNIVNPPPSTIPNRIDPFYIGRVVLASGSGVYFQGQIDEVRLWNYARTQTEIRRDMCRRLTGNEPGLAGYWRLDECRGTTAFDSSVNGNHGTLY